MDTSAYEWLYRVARGYGVVPVFAAGLAGVLTDTPASIIACLHDDVWIEEEGWDQKVLDFFAANPRCGLLGFGGATGLGAADIYHRLRGRGIKVYLPAESDLLKSLFFYGYEQEAAQAFDRKLAARVAEMETNIGNLDKEIERLTEMRAQYRGAHQDTIHWRQNWKPTT